MFVRYDAETLLNDLFTIFKDNLNAQITKIQAEKDFLLGADNFDMPLIGDDAWLDSLDDRVANFDPFVYFNYSDQTIIEQPSAGASDYTIFFTVVKQEQDQLQSYKRMLRYTRALSQVSEKKFDKLTKASVITISELTPTNISLNENSDDMHKLAGIAIQVAIG